MGCHQERYSFGSISTTAPFEMRSLKANIGLFDSPYEGSGGIWRHFQPWEGGWKNESPQDQPKPSSRVPSQSRPQLTYLMTILEGNARHNAPLPGILRTMTNQFLTRMPSFEQHVHQLLNARRTLSGATCLFFELISQYLKRRRNMNQELR